MTADAVHGDASSVAQEIIRRTGGDIRLALPLGLGKANSIVNALTERAVENRSIRLAIFTALTLERPDPRDPFGSRLIGPARDRLFGRYPALRYAELLRAGDLPENITVQEFFFLAGKWLGHGAAQQAHIPVNYTDALEVLLAQRPNLVAQLLAQDETGRLSLSGNTDISADLLALRREGRVDFLFAGELNAEWPFMPGSAVIAYEECDLLLDPPDGGFELFSVPAQPVHAAEHAIGLHVSRLVPDGGTLQIGIGAMGDAVAHALRLRHTDPDAHRHLVERMPFPAPVPEDHGGRFDTGLYAATEMLVEGLLALYEAGVIARVEQGAAIHAGFFLGSRDFRRRLREMPPERRALIDMRPVSFTNALYGDEDGKRRARRDARFVNSTMKVTALGAAVSDALEDGQVVSGVGGQFDFVAQAFALQGARSIITLPATRTRKGKVRSNIVWAHPNETVPRHMRDIVVTEYGVADLRGRPDAETIRALIRIADSRFQEGLAEKARRAGKLPRGWRVPETWLENTPERLADWISPAGEALPPFPFGSDFETAERDLLPALDLLRAHRGDWPWLAGTVLKGLGAAGDGERPGLTRMALDIPRGIRERTLRAVLLGAMRRAGARR